MKINYSWLCEYLEEKPKLDDVIYNLKKIGFGIESIERIGVNCDKVITAKILEVKKHPNADKLSLCRLTTGSIEYEVVCGAPNVKEGLVVPLALVGARLGDITIKKAKIRGIESNGMICSAEELGLEKKSDGIMVLNNNIPLGREIKDFFEEDYIIDIEITPNLAYCLSHYGLARELSIFAGYKLVLPQLSSIDVVGNFDFKIDVKTSNCLRYLGIVVKNIKNKKTPDFISNRLKKIGLNPKGNILIDISNYVMFETGQPNHFFDLSRIDSITVRQASNGEEIKTLDGNIYKLDEDIMVIADSNKPIAIAGVIGGYDSSIDDNTTDIVIEIANFKPEAVRLASKKFSVKTDSSYRFERGVDYNVAEFAAKRIIYLIKQTNPEAEIKMVKDIKNISYAPLVIDVDVKKIESILGINVDFNKLNELLKRMDPSFDGKRFVPPSYRYDLSNIWDISEEYLRYVGYDSIQSKTTMSLEKACDDPIVKMREYISLRLSKLGFNECYTYDLVSEKDISSCNFDIKKSVRLLNPLSKDFEYLRPSGLLSMLKVLRHNINRDVESVRIYEFGSVFSREIKGVDEKLKLFILVWGNTSEWEWWKDKNKRIDFFDLKTAIDVILNYEAEWENKVILPSLLYGGIIKYRGVDIGWGGEIKKDVIRKFDIKTEDVFYAEIDIGSLVRFYELDFYKMVRKPKKPSPYQCGVRDLSIIVNKKYSFSDVISAIDKISDICNIQLIDVYEDSKLGSDVRSLTFRFTFSSYQKTFTDDELNKKIEEIFLTLKDKFSVSLR